MSENNGDKGLIRQTLGQIRAVTYTVPDLGTVEAAYVEFLGYRVLARGNVPHAQARAWGAPGVEGRSVLTLGPASGENVFLRFIECPEAEGWRAFDTFGWNATEFVVQNVDVLAQQLAASPFTIIGAPKGLNRFPMIRAMQVLGPAGECCYFTEIGSGSGLSLADARSFVGRVFIVVVAGPDADVLYRPYALFSNRQEAPVATPVQVISRMHRLPPETLHRHGLVRLPEGTLIELDQYPSSAAYRSVRSGLLPAGMAIVTFEVQSVRGVEFTGGEAPSDLPGLRGRSWCLQGAVGELIELFTCGI